MLYFILFFFFKQKTAYEMRISDWSSDVCSSDLAVIERADQRDIGGGLAAFVGDKGQRCINRIEQRIGAHRHRLFAHFDAHNGKRIGPAHNSNLAPAFVRIHLHPPVARAPTPPHPPPPALHTLPTNSYPPN